MKRYETLIVVCRGHLKCLFIGFFKGFVPWMFRGIKSALCQIVLMKKFRKGLSN